MFCCADNMVQQKNTEVIAATYAEVERLGSAMDRQSVRVEALENAIVELGRAQQAKNSQSNGFSKSDQQAAADAARFAAMSAQIEQMQNEHRAAEAAEVGQTL